MARRAKLIASALLVLAVHALVLDWFAHLTQVPPPVRLMTDPMFTRMISVTPPPAVQRPETPAAPLHRAPPADAQVLVAASTPAPTDPTLAPPPQEQAPEPPVVVEPAPPVPLPEPSPMQPPLPFPWPGAPSAPLVDWPADTRLSYAVTGWFRGELQGDARVQWQREADRYQVRVEIDISTFISLSMTSQGQVTPRGLRPSAYEETRRGRTRALRMNDADLVLEDGVRLPRPDKLQDTASQFVELAWRLANQPLQTGSQVSFWMARPGAVDLWTYDVVERVTLQTPKLGAVEAFHLKPRPIANPRGNITAEMWFAPGLQYLPVRIRINQGSDVYLDLLVDKIEQ